MKQFVRNALLVLSLMALSFIGGVNKDAIGEWWHEYSEQAAAQNEKNQRKRAKQMALDCDVAAKGVDNYGILLLQGKTGYNPHFAIQTYKDKAERLNDIVRQYAALWERYHGENGSLPDPAQFMRPVDAPDQKLLQTTVQSTEPK